MMTLKIPQKMLEDLQKCVDVVKKHDTVQIFSHYDADGISSAAIISIALDRAGIRNSVLTFPTLSEKEMNVVRETEFDCMVMTDLGTSYLPQISALDKDCVVLDHHRLPKNYSEGMHPNVAFSNCEKYGFSGTTDACAATMACLFAICLDETNEDLIQLAIAGMIGDNQLYGKPKELNGYVIDLAIKKGYVKPLTTILPYGKVSDYLMIGTTPYLKGISGDLLKIRDFLNQGGFPEDVEISDVNTSEAQRLDEYVRQWLKNNGPENCNGETLVSRFWLCDYGLDGEILSLMLDSCGRSFKKDMGLQVCREKDYALAMEMVKVFRKPLMQLLTEVQDGGIHMCENFCWFQHSYESVGGIACMALSRYVYGRKYPIVSLNVEESEISLSSRCQKCLCETGIDMNMAMRQATNPLGGEGGGHINAAGGSIAFEKRDLFLEALDTILGEQKKHCTQ